MGERLYFAGVRIISQCIVKKLQPKHSEAMYSKHEYIAYIISHLTHHIQSEKLHSDWGEKSAIIDKLERNTMLVFLCLYCHLLDNRVMV